MTMRALAQAERRAMEWNILWYVLALVLAFIGLVGLVIPAVPGVPLVFAGMLLAAWVDGFEHIGTLVLVVLGMLTLASVVIDVLSSVFGAQRVGASRLALLGAFVGTLAGMFFLPWGLFIGPFAGATTGEYLYSRKPGKAARVGVGTSLGIALGMALKLALTVVMFGVFALAWWI